MFNSQKMDQKSIFLSLLVLFLINQVSARKCYWCWSELHGDCIKSPEQEIFELNCQEPFRTTSNDVGPSSPFSTTFKGLYDLYPSAFDYQCATVSYTNVTDSKTSLVRGCIAKHISDESFKILNLAHGWLQVDKIRRCNNDFCNNIKA